MAEILNETFEKLSIYELGQYGDVKIISNVTSYSGSIYFPNIQRRSELEIDYVSKTISVFISLELINNLYDIIFRIEDDKIEMKHLTKERLDKAVESIQRMIDGVMTDIYNKEHKIPDPTKTSNNLYPKDSHGIPSRLRRGPPKTEEERLARQEDDEKRQQIANMHAAQFAGTPIRSLVGSKEVASNNDILYKPTDKCLLCSNQITPVELKESVRKYECGHHFHLRCVGDNEQTCPLKCDNGKWIL